MNWFSSFYSRLFSKRNKSFITIYVEILPRSRAVINTRGRKDDIFVSETAKCEELIFLLEQLKAYNVISDFKKAYKNVFEIKIPLDLDK